MERNRIVDTLRGLAMFAMMVIHACSYYFDSELTHFIWDNLQFAVPVFLFCSFYLFYSKTKEFPKNHWIPYLKKRLTRLLLPYFYFLAVLFPLLYVFQDKNFNLNYLFANVFLYKGVDFNWLVLLFVYLIFIMPLVLLIKKNKVLYYGYFALSLLSSVVFIFHPVNHRLIMWLPWSLYIYFTIFFITNISNKKLLLMTAIASGAVFLGTRALESAIGHNLTQYANKYPPTIYHLSFGIFWIIILWYLAKKNIFSLFKFDRLLHFLSVNSYSLYFIHIIVMFTLDWLKLKPASWPLFFLEIIVFSSVIQIGYNKLQTYGFKK